jgi:hypothetical protein
MTGEPAGKVPLHVIAEVDDALRLHLALWEEYYFELFLPSTVGLYVEDHTDEAPESPAVIAPVQLAG